MKALLQLTIEFDVPHPTEETGGVTTETLVGVIADALENSIEQARVVSYNVYADVPAPKKKKKERKRSV